jgi:hypothetical protein
MFPFYIYVKRIVYKYCKRMKGEIYEILHFDHRLLIVQINRIE